METITETIKLINNFINKKTKNKDTYFEHKINDYLLIWGQNFYGELYFELQARTSTDEDFGNFCININEIKNENKLQEFLTATLTEIENYGINQYINKHEKIFL